MGNLGTGGLFLDRNSISPANMRIKTKIVKHNVSCAATGEAKNADGSKNEAMLCGRSKARCCNLGI
jgi:hypothetical protein